MKRLYYYTLILFFAGKAFAQPYYFRHYQVEDGLSNSTVFCSAQDSYGFLWFGTKEGLNRFDGYHFKLFHLYDNKDEKTISSDIIYCLFKDNYGKLWVGAEKGLFWFDAQKERLVSLQDSLPNVNAIVMDKSGRLWFIAGTTLCRYNFTSKELKQFAPAKYFYATSVCTSDDGSIWASTTDGYLKKFDEAGDAFISYDLFSHSQQPTSRWIQKIGAGDKHSLFIGTSSQGLKKFDIATSAYKDVLTYNPDKTTIFVRDILKNSGHEFWFATESGIFIYETDKEQFINLKKKFLDPYSITDNAVYTLCKDAEGGIWAGTYFGGLNYYAKEYAGFEKYFPDNTAYAISGNAVREICEDNNGNLWIGTEDAGLNKLTKKTQSIIHFKPTGEKTSITYSNIHGLMIDGNDLWIGTFEHGIDIMDVRTGKVKKHFIAGPGNNDLKSNFTVCFLHHSTGKIYVGTSNGLFSYSAKTNNFERPIEADENIFVSAITEDHTKTIWVATHDRGVFWFNPLTGDKGHLINEPNNRNSLTNNTINAVFEDSDNNIWFCTEGGGLCKLSSDRKTITRFTTKNGFPSNFIFKVLEDDNKHLWVSTSKGLVKFDTQKQTTFIYTKANGLLNDQFNYNSGYKNKQGKLYFGSVKGMISFSPDDIVSDSFIPPVFITGLQVHNKELLTNEDSSILKKSISFTDKIILPYYQSSISIDFAALSYTSPGMTAYSYKLEGLDKEWTFLKLNRKVYFTNLSPGTYTFKVRAAANGVVAKSEKQITIKILPPYWATSRAYLLYTIISILLTYYLIKSYHKTHQNKKEREIYEAKIDFFTNVAHEIKTPLTLIKGPLENLMEKVDEIPEIKDDVGMMNRNTKRLLNLVTQILDFRQTEIKGFSLDFTSVNICELLNETYINFKTLAGKRKLMYELALPPLEVCISADEEALQKIFSNLFSNAIKYADKKVIIQLHEKNKNQEIVIEIKNDGLLIPFEMKERIFEPFYRLHQNVKQKGTGIGLTLARSLTELHKGNLYVKDSKEAMNIFILVLPAQTEQNKNSQQINTTLKL